MKNSRLNKTLALQRSRRQDAAVFSLAGGVAFCLMFFENDSILLNLLVVGLAYCLIFIPLNIFLVTKSVTDVYGDDLEELANDLEEYEEENEPET
jgi:hypothetical protein